MQRRAFIQSTLAGAVGMALASSASASTPEPAGLGNVVFTDSDPGHWSGKEKLHVPIVDIKGDSLTVTTPHPMSEAHYIVSHAVVLQGGKPLGRKTFTWKDQPVSTYKLPAGYKGSITVASTCNQHDFWMKQVSV